MTIRFDDSLPAFTEIVVGVLGGEVMASGVVLRDAVGRLTFIATQPLPDGQIFLAEDALSRLDGYVNELGWRVLGVDRPGAAAIVAESRIRPQPVRLPGGGEQVVRILDRRIVGRDWLTSPAPGWQLPEPGRMVFASLKGGVGRSTALAVLAVDLALSGRNILVVDLDLEAPGIGTMLIETMDRPRYGALDWFVEHGLSIVDEDFLEAMVAPSRFGRGRGVIDVVPAVGVASDDYPANVLGKLARAYLEDPRLDGPPASFLCQTQALITLLTKRRRYDAVLIDARAGLNESTAAAILGLGADVLLFGVDMPQTFSGYRYLLAHLAGFPRVSEDDDWLLRLKLVQAKTSLDANDQKRFRDQAFDVFNEWVYRDKTVDLEGQEIEDREFSADSEEAPHFAWPILFDGNYLNFDALRDPRLLQEEYYIRTFSAFLRGAKERLGIEGDTP